MKAIAGGVEVQTPSAVYTADKVFDSRPPRYLQPEKNEAHLLQSFLGYVITPDKLLSETDCVDLMDFEVAQQGNTQFVYTLPFSENKLLVELTRFGAAAITAAEAEPVLQAYISKHYGNYTIVETEKGCIPMSTAATTVENIPGVIPIGGRAGAIKPSTGYAFKNMARHAETIATALQNNTTPNTIESAARFKFYDRLLLLILLKQPQMGKQIFQSLFQKNKTIDVLRFLDEKTSLYQDLSILFSLPILPFIRTWWYDTKVRYQQLLAPVALLLLATILCVVQNSSENIFNWTQGILFTLGLFSIGIPHGAIDHLLESGHLEWRGDIRFILRYLGMGVAYLFVWLALPSAALLFFLLYSIWHFGQCDMQQWQPEQKRPYKNWAWGILLFGIILLGHIAATNELISNMGTHTLPLNSAQGKLLAILLSLSALVWGIAERRPAMVLSALMLAIGIELPLLTAFGLYFIGQHSLNGWSHLKKGFKTDNLTLFKKALPFTFGAFLLFTITLICMERGWLDAFNQQKMALFFVFISCISFPHVLSMHVFYRKHAKNQHFEKNHNN